MDQELRLAKNPPGAREFGTEPNADRFALLAAAYQASGGLAPAEVVAPALGGGMARVARCVASGELVGFRWDGGFWLPMFQFDADRRAVRTSARRVLDELSGVFDSWSLAVWFASPNRWLRDRRPADLLESNLAAVLQAAQGDHFIAGGEEGP